MTTSLFNPDLVRQAINVLVESGNVFEIRALDARLGNQKWKSTVSGYFDNAAAAVTSLATIGEFALQGSEELWRAIELVPRTKQSGNVGTRESGCFPDCTWRQPKKAHQRHQANPVAPMDVGQGNNAP